MKVKLLYGTAIVWGLPMLAFDMWPYLKMTPLFSVYLLGGFVPLFIYLVYCFVLGLSTLRKWIFKKELDRQAIFRIKLGALAMVSFIATARISAWTGKHYPYKSWELKFDSSEWIKEKNHSTTDDKHISVRQKMIADLLENNLTGRSRGEVHKLLGEPDKGASHWRADLVYHLGLERENWLRMDDEWLFIYFDSSEKVNRTHIHTD